MSVKILIILTSQKQIPKTGTPTGWYLPELAHVYEILREKVEIIIASPKGGEAPLDPSSIKAFKADERSTKFLETKNNIWRHTRKLAEVLPRAGTEYDAVLFIGGHGPMFDLVTDSTSLAIIQSLAGAKKPIAALCHGTCALLNATAPSGEPLLEGAAVTGFSNDEEEELGMMDVMPFSLENELNRVSGGGYFKSHETWVEKVVVSKAAGTGSPIITGQNPLSATGVGREILKVLGL